MFGLFLVFGCTSSVEKTDTGTTVHSDTGQSQQDLCSNTFDPTPMPDLRLTEYGTDVPTIESVLPDKLSETELYTDILNEEVHPAIQWFRPVSQLWSDGESKNRWVYIPECAQIDSSDMNNWSFPVGTRFFKEFSVDGKKVETRYIQRLGTGEREFAFASYLWNEEQTEAYKLDRAGMVDVLGTSHIIPSWEQCVQCHGTYPLGGGRPSRGLGFSAMMLSEVSEGLSLRDLVEADRLSHPPTAPIQIPGDEQTKKALGYLHINCGTCHNQSEDGLPQLTMNLWLDVEHTSVTETNAWQTTVGIDTQVFKDQQVSARISPGHPEGSALYYRMRHRDNAAQMPPVGTRIVDEEGLAIIKEWIEAME